MWISSKAGVGKTEDGVAKITARDPPVGNSGLLGAMLYT